MGDKSNYSTSLIIYKLQKGQIFSGLLVRYFGVFEVECPFVLRPGTQCNHRSNEFALKRAQCFIIRRRTPQALVQRDIRSK